MTATEESVAAELRRGRDEVRDLAAEVAGIAEDLRGLVRSEVELARAETRQQVNLLVRSAIWGGLAAICATLGVIFLAITAMYALWVVLPLWLSALIVAAGLLLIAGIAGLMVRARIKQVSVIPKRTVKSLREDVAWAKSQLKSSTT
jgi:uncharacterized membrane protein YqjE